MGTDYIGGSRPRHRHVAEEYRTIALGTSDEGCVGSTLDLQTITICSLQTKIGLPAMASS